MKKNIGQHVVTLVLGFFAGIAVTLFSEFFVEKKIEYFNDRLFAWSRPNDVARFEHAKSSVEQILRQTIPLSARDQQSFDSAVEIMGGLAQQNYIVAIRYFSKLNCDWAAYSTRLYEAQGLTFALIGSELGDMVSKKHFYFCLGKI